MKVKGQEIWIFRVWMACVWLAGLVLGPAAASAWPFRFPCAARSAHGRRGAPRELRPETESLNRRDLGSRAGEVQGLAHAIQSPDAHHRQIPTTRTLSEL